MNKKIITIMMLGIFLTGFISAGILTAIVLTNVEYTKSIPIEKTIDTITMKCDGKLISINGSEPGGKYDSNDVRSLMDANCNGTSTEFTKDELVWKTNEYGTESFDEAELKEDYCSKEGLIYDSKLDKCIEPVVDEPIGEVSE